MLHSPHRQRTVEMRLATDSARWAFWTEENVAKIEDNIRYDLEHDGYRVQIERIMPIDEPCSTDMIWQLLIKPA